MGTILVNTTSAFSDGDQITSDSLNNLIDDAILNTTAVSAGTGLTVNGTTGVLSLDSSLTGKVLTGGSLNNAPIGASTPSTGAFTTLSSSSGYTGNVTGNVTGDVTGNISGNVTGGTGSFTTLSASGDVTFDTTTLKVDSTNNRVGIGTASPSKLLHVKSPNSDTAEAVAGFGNGDIDVGLEIKTNGNGGSSLDWGFNAVNSRHLVFDTNQTERMRISSSGEVGIGDNDPSKELVVKNIATAGTESIVNIISGNAGVAGVYFGDSDDDIVGGIVYDNSADTLQLRSSNNQTAVTINSSEQVGIGTTPSYKLDVNSGATNQVALFESTDATAYIELADDTGSAQLLTPSSGDFKIYTGGSGAGNLGTSKLVVEAGGSVGIGDDTPSHKLDVNGTGRFVGQLTLDDEVLHNISGTQTRQPGYFAGTYGLEIEQTAQGSTIHIGRSNGNCMNIGADATAAGTDVNVVYFRDTGSGSPVATEVGKITIDTTSTNYATSSDYRLKENEVDITDGIDRLKELKPYRFNFTRNPSKVVDGFFAHEVSPVVPESISGEKDQVDDEGNPVYQGIDQSKLVPLLTAALQEAVTKIEALEARVQTLEG